MVGVLGTLAGLLIRSELERRAELRSHRRKLIHAWRSATDRAWPVGGGTVSFAPVAPLTESPDWLSLRRHLHPSLRERLEGSQPEAAVIGSHSPLRAELLDAIDDLERRWRLCPSAPDARYCWFGGVQPSGGSYSRGRRPCLLEPSFAITTAGSKQRSIWVLSSAILPVQWRVTS